MKKLFIIMALIGLNACQTKLSQLQNSSPAGHDAYTLALVSEYLHFSEQEADQYDWVDSSYFANKGLRLYRGEDVGPENYKDWDLPKDASPVFIQAQEHLMTVLTAQMKQQSPEQLAKVVFYFDCWIEEQEENWQFNRIDNCRENFYALLDRLYAMDGNKKASLQSRMSDVKPVVFIDPVHIYFQSGSASLSKEGLLQIDRLAEKLENGVYADISVNGYADREGATNNNLELSKKRAKTVKEALIKHGISAELITMLAFGETTNKVKTDDGVAHAKNRVVDIVIE